MATSIISRLLALVVAAIYYLLRPVWLKLWPPLQILYIFCKRSLLRRKNLVQPLTLPDQSAVREPNTPPQVRTFEGSGNNRQQTTMGMTGCPFSRNTPPVAGTPSEVAAQGPEPTEVSQKLLKRPGGTTKTRPLVNLLGGEGDRLCADTGVLFALEVSVCACCLLEAVCKPPAWQGCRLLAC